MTVTHPDMTRYFMTIPEACQLVLQAGSMGRGGEIFILDMGEPVRDRRPRARPDLALRVACRAQDIEIEFTGIRPGEKLYEELSVEDEHADKTRHPHIFVGRVRSYGWQEASRHVRVLAALSDSRNSEGIRHALADAIPEYRQPDAVQSSEPEPARRAPRPSPSVSSADPSPA